MYSMPFNISIFIVQITFDQCHNFTMNYLNDFIDYFLAKFYLNLPYQ